jgi:hypothetical protein
VIRNGSPASDDKKGKVLGTGVIKVNNFTLEDVTLVNKLIYNLLSVSQLVDADLDVFFHKSGSKVFDSHGDLVIVDNYSCYSWVFFLESKDEVFEHFRSLALRLNNEHPNCLKSIRSDNGTEFRNPSFD